MANPSDKTTRKKRRRGESLVPATRVEAEDVFIAALTESPNITEAARKAGVARQTLYDWRKESSSFAARWDDALNASVDDLEVEAFRRAKAGSDTLTIFLLKAHRPEKYQDQVKHEHSGPNGGPIPFSYESIIAEVTTGSGSDSEGER